MGEGISAAAVYSIVSARVAPLEHGIAVLQHRLSELEQEMANVENAVREMHRGLVGGLDELKSGNAALLDVQQQTKKITLEQFVSTNAQLGAANVQLHTTNNNLGAINQTSLNGFQTLDVGIDRMAQALVQTEVIRLLHEAKEPTARVHAFAEEIEERFAKTIESVFLVRQQYDHLLGTAMTEYENKLRLIGEHIYEMKESHFEQFAEVPLCSAPGNAVELPLALDEQRLERRREALDSRFDKLGDSLIEPLLMAHRSLEHKLASEYTAAFETTGEEVALPVAVRIAADGRVEVLGRVAFSFNPELAQSERKLAMTAVDEPGAQAAMKARVEPIGGRLKTQTLNEAQLKSLKLALENLGSAGRIDPDLLPGYYEYLDRYGLEVVSEQELNTP